MDLMKILEERRRAAGGTKRLSYDNFGQVVGIPGPTMWRLMNGKTKPALDTLLPLFAWGERNKDGDLIKALLNYLGVTAQIEVKY